MSKYYSLFYHLRPRPKLSVIKKAYYELQSSEHKDSNLLSFVSIRYKNKGNFLAVYVRNTYVCFYVSNVAILINEVLLAG